MQLKLLALLVTMKNTSRDHENRVRCWLELVRTNLNYHVLGTSTAAIFLSNDHFLYAPITSDECHA